MVATVIMSIAVVGVLSAMSTSLRNAARLTAYDRAVMLGRSKMDELLVDQRIPIGATLNGKFDGSSGDNEIGWNARVTQFDNRPEPPVGAMVLERVELEIYWTTNGRRYSFPLEGFKRALVTSAPL
jgi:type II secretory pathway pseudopilin PulG